MFNPGDKVRALQSSSAVKGKSAFIKGNIYEVIKHSNDPFWIIDEQGSKNGWNQSYFELVQKKEKHYKWQIKIHTIEAVLLPGGHTKEHKKQWIESDHYVSEEKIESYLTNYIKDKYQCEILEYAIIIKDFKEE